MGGGIMNWKTYIEDCNREEEEKWAMFPNYETPKEKKQRRAEENANIQRVDAQTKKYWGK